jgi:acyl-coenzyme A synthetase/AMP-(fatty) acid ligase
MSSSDTISAEVNALFNAISYTPDMANHAESMLYRHCKKGRGSENALYFDGETYSYRQVADAAASCAAWLRSLGIGAGHSVILSLPDCPVLAATYFGVVAVGATAIILNPSLPTEDAFYIAQLCKARLTITYEKFLGRLLSLKSLESMITVRAAGLSWRGSSEIAESVPVTQNAEYTVFGSSNSYAYGLLSSGSTGRPKLIVHRHEDIFYGYLAFARSVLQLCAADRVVCVAKMTTGYGLGCSLLMPFLAGASSALVSETPGTAVTTAIETHRCTLLFAQPRFLAETLSHSELANTLLSLRLVITGGEPLGSALVDRWAHFSQAELLDSYGSTEIGFLYISNRPGHARRGSVGKPVAQLEVEVVDENNEPVQVGQTGKLRVRGPMVISGYWNDPVRTSQYFKDGWFTTSDMFSFDDDGYYYIHGRSDHLIKLGCGDWVNPNELEMVLLEHASVNECAVIGAPDEAGLTILKALIVVDTASDRSQALATELSNMIRDRWPMEGYKRIGVIELTAALPKTAAGKLDRLKLSPQSMTEFSYKC